MHIHVDATVPKEDAAWKLLAQLGRLHEWAPDVAASEAGPLAVGTVRLVRLEEPVFGTKVLRERITHVTPRSFTYEIEGGIGPLRRIQTTWRIAHGRVQLDSHVDLAWYAKPVTGAARRQWETSMTALLAGFVAYLTR